MITRNRLVGGDQWPFGTRCAIGALVVGVVVLMLGIGYHLMSIPPPSAEEQRVASRQEQLDVQARQESLARERAAAMADQQLDATWRPWRTAAVNVLEISVTLGPVLALGVGGLVLMQHGRPPHGFGAGLRGSRMPSTRSWLRSRSWWSRPALVTPPRAATTPSASRPPGGPE